ncbi:MAG: asparagine synthase (glutamine-hydrolyzing) [Elusimicrobia bacterium RIFOXYA2_FULL_47_53]|nr:MAG: asparagine synthase (glutamine-hydrolyzing) [Elusimicrobia bacterium RIFOXYA12_FULL_49_49]OGS16775.1 MAG: asparagine synthase (glutamine-hydrolyzing) [Elusimicrobia bacterium RIFOXYA2_FULL_47_53]OGS32003.1 MAG: asparagine synthase (glutamine-hydrolyzing) [Elusimicrobia bacterium RIFOXYB2_FULL_46_23]
MCGIFGFTDGFIDPKALIKKMASLLVHRGPDGEGFFLDDSVSMGMRRLSIIDIAHGNQPFFSQDGTIVAFCNGEIYNYKELREELIAKGFEFKTNSDVEVIPHLFSLYGTDFAKKLNGMYAIAIYDRKDKSIYLVRDRLGIKPLYYSVIGNRLIYASEIKPILASGIQREPDMDAISTYLELMYIPAPSTPFKNIYKLESGKILHWSNGRISTYRYWDLSLREVAAPDEDAIISQLDEILNDSVRLELRSDVEVGSLLSGGVDSSIITAIAAIKSPNKLSAFHMQWNSVKGKIDESKYAEAVSGKYSANLFIQDVDKIDIPALLPKLIFHLEEPFADAAFIPTYLLSNIASKKVKVILSGAGGDELLGGYAQYGNISYFKSLLKSLLFDKNPYSSYFDLISNPSGFNWKGTFNWFKAKSMKSVFEEKFAAFSGTDRINAMMLNDLSVYLQDDILFLTDKMSMAASLETRVPYLDHRLVELCQNIPSAIKLKNRISKYLLKKLGEKYLPKDLIYRQKEGFGSPVWLWVNQYKDLYFDYMLENGYLVKNNLISKDMINHFTYKTRLGIKDSWQYWHIIVLEIWFRLFIEGQSNDEIFN